MAEASDDCVGGQAVLVSGLTDHCDFLRDLDRATFTLGDKYRCQQTLMGEGKLSQFNYTRHYCEGPGASHGVHPLGLPPASHPSIRENTRQVDGGANKRELKQAISRSIGNLRSNNPFLLYFSDHGSTNGRDDSSSSMVNMQDRSNLSPDELRLMISRVPKNSPVTLINDHCHSSGMLHALFDLNGRPRENACGAAAAHSNEYSYSGQSIMDHATRLKNDPQLFKAADRDKDGAISLHELMDFFRSRPDSSQNIGEGVFSAGVTTSAFFLEQYAKKHGVIQSSSDRKIDELSRCGMEESLISRFLYDRIFDVQKILVKSRSQEMDAEIDSLQKACPDTIGDTKLTVRELEEKQNAREREIHDLLKKKLLLRDVIYDGAVASLEKSYPGWAKMYQDISVQAQFMSLYLSDKDSFCRGIDPSFVCCGAQERGKKITLQIPISWRTFWSGSADFSCTSNGAIRLKNLAASMKSQLTDAYEREEKTLSIAEKRQQIYRAHRDKNMAARQCRMLLTKLRERESLRFMLERGDMQAFQDYFALQSCERRPLFHANPVEARNPLAPEVPL